MNIMRRVIDANDEHSWQQLLTFPYMVFRLPLNRYKDKGLSTIILNNLKKFSEGESLSEILKSFPVPSFSMDNGGEAKRVKVAEMKLGEGDVRAAVRMLTSTDRFAEHSVETYTSLLEKHPQTVLSTTEFEPASQSVDELTVAPSELMGAIRAFPRASGSGLDGLRPRHLLDLLSKDNPHAAELAETLMEFLEIVLNGRLPQFILPLFYGASLTALMKLGGGIRPIACGLTLRRLAAKVAVKKLEAIFRDTLLPHQVGVGVKGGAEAAVLAVRTHLSTPHAGTKIMVKLDFANAFNTIARGKILFKVQQSIPSLYPMTLQSYGSPSYLAYGEHLLESRCGVQQGDPLGPALFCLAIDDLVKSLRSEVKPWYLDDGTLIGEPTTVIEDVQKIMNCTTEIGLRLNTEKCEIFAFGGTEADRLAAVNLTREHLPSVRSLQSHELQLLGLPLSIARERSSLEEKTVQMRTFSDRLDLVHPQAALYLLRYSLGVPRVVYLLRGSPCYRHPELLSVLDDLFKTTVVKITNVQLDDLAWRWASLPLKAGGLGIRKPSSLALPAYLGSLVQNCAIAKSLLSSSGQLSVDLQVEVNTAYYRRLYSSLPEVLSQSALDDVIIQQDSSGLESAFEADNRRKAAFLASRDVFSGRFLQALPSSQTGTMLDPISFRMAVGLRMGLPVCVESTCVLCGRQADSLGTHALSCTMSSGRRSRHSALNQEVARSLRRAGIPSRLEPTGLVRIGARRPDGVSLINWENGKPLAWDATVGCTTANIHVERTSKNAGAAAEQAELDKFNKYRDISHDYVLKPLCFETHGPISHGTREFLNDLGKRLGLSTGDPRQGKFLEQRLALAIVRGNSASILGALGDDLPV
jgi:Reverse transcriptase (RNA-dependent DNA polymerase)